MSSFEAMASKFPSLSLFLVLTCSGFASAAALEFPKLGIVRETGYGNVSKSQSTLDESIKSGYIIYNYTQTLDHFNYQPESCTTFQQRYAINYKYWGGAKSNSPIFLYTGDESSLEGDLAAAGFLLDNAAHFQALLLVIEVRIPC